MLRQKKVYTAAAAKHAASRVVYTPTRVPYHIPCPAAISYFVAHHRTDPQTRLDEMIYRS